MKKFFRPLNIVIYIITLVAIIAISLSIFIYREYLKVKTQLENPARVTETANKTILEKLGKLIQLPTEENPTIATVNDIEKLKDQDFFANAKNGDKLIVYTNAKKAILYDLIANRIIDVAPVNIGTQSANLSATPGASPSTQATQITKVALYNGTTTVGLTALAEKFLKEKLGSQIEIVSKDNAVKQDYEKTVVVDLNNNGDQATPIALAFSTNISALPEGEKKPVVTGNTVDTLVILGKDFKGN